MGWAMRQCRSSVQKSLNSMPHQLQPPLVGPPTPAPAQRLPLVGGDAQERHRKHADALYPRGAGRGGGGARRERERGPQGLQQVGAAPVQLGKWVRDRPALGPARPHRARALLENHARAHPACAFVSLFCVIRGGLAVIDPALLGRVGASASFRSLWHRWRPPPPQQEQEAACRSTSH